jgi:hypothetical protein
VFAADESIVVSPKGVELPTIVLQFVVFDECEGFYVCFELVKDFLFAALESEFFFDDGVGTASSPFHALYFELEHFA